MAASQRDSRSEVYQWLSLISPQGLHLERLVLEFESRGFQTKQSLKYLEKGNLDVIINSPHKLLLAEKRIMEKEIENLKKPSLALKELFPHPSSSIKNNFSPSLSVNNSMNNASLASSNSGNGESAGTSKNTQQEGYLDRKAMEMSNNLTVLETQIQSAKEHLETVQIEYEQSGSKAVRRRGKLCANCHMPGHYKSKCNNTPCTNMKNCSVSEKHPEAKTELIELQKLIRELKKKEVESFGGTTVIQAC